MSCATHSTMVCPIGNSDSDGGIHVTVTSPELSVALGSWYTTTAVEFPGSVSISLFAGHALITGSSTSGKQVNTNEERIYESSRFVVIPQTIVPGTLRMVHSESNTAPISKNAVL